MDCQPVGESLEVVYQEPTNKKSSFNLDWIYAAIYVICGIILAFVLTKTAMFLFSNINYKAEPKKSLYTI
jgi:hypothetical protein